VTVQDLHPRGRPVPAARSPWRAVALPAEHGGWGLTLEPVVLGLAVRPSVAGVLLGLAALVAFLVRTPLKLVVGDRLRRRRLDRTGRAALVAGGELAVLGGLVGGAVALAAAPWWSPLPAMAALAAVGLSYDVRARSRRLVPELAGSIAIAGAAAVIALAGGADARLAVGAWVLLAARTISAVTTVRDVVRSIHGRPRDRRACAVADAVGIGGAAVAVVLAPALALGGGAVLAAIALQRAWNRRPPPRPVVIGLRQLGLGMAVVLAAAIGVAVA